MMEKAHLKVVRQGGAGYLSKQSRYFPRMAKRLDKSLQKISDKKKASLVHYIGNSVVLVAKK